MQANQNDSYPRIPTEGNVLWEIAGPVNNMIARFHRLRNTEAEHQQYTRELTMLLSALRTAQINLKPPRLPVGERGYVLAPLYIEIDRLLREKGNAGQASAF